MDKQKQAAQEFVKDWTNHGYEKGEAQKFWLALLNRVLNVRKPDQFIQFEDSITLYKYQEKHKKQTGFIDGYIPSTGVMIEQKGIEVSLDKEGNQSDGKKLTPFMQAKRYWDDLDRDKKPRWIVVSNFKEFQVYDMDKLQSGKGPEIIKLEDLPNEYHRLEFLVNPKHVHIEKEKQLSMKAGDIIGRLYDEILKHYINPDSPKTLKSLNILCVRLVFCLYAEDAKLFGSKSMFHDYLKQYPAKQLREALKNLFVVLDTPEEERDPYLPDDLAAFPYVNGGLFSDESIEIPQFDDKIRELLLAKASNDFDWSGISPTIFGSLFESTLNQETRRKGGMHYTSIENIHKVIDPLFLDSLKKELEEIRQIKVPATRNKNLGAFQDKLASLSFLDPACGSGNFLTETYISLRRLENIALDEINAGQTVMDFGDVIKVSIGQFYGIEINDFAVTVARAALWIAENQMMKETEEIVHRDLDPLPLKSYPNIKEANALRIDWNTVIPKEKLCYIMGNPPFVGASMMTAEQKNDSVEVFGKIKLSNSIDYVGAWYYKAAQLMAGTKIKAALVSTNSITQGEQVAPLWKKLIVENKLHILFAYRTFRWDSEANIKAHIHCVIIGFSCDTDGSDKKSKYIFTGDDAVPATNINPYLIDAPTVFIESRSKPICNVPPMTLGNKPTDDGNFILTQDQRDELIQKYPQIAPHIRRYIGAVDFLNNNQVRYCLWLKDVSPSVYAKIPEVMKRLQNIRDFRSKSTAEPTRKAAAWPYRFFSTPQTNTNYLIIPGASSERRYYLPIGFMDGNNIASNACSIILNASLYHFGILTSNVHMSWMRVVCGRLKSDYRYSGAIVYNNFPWPDVTEKMKDEIAAAAQGILDARARFSGCSLAELYDEAAMQSELRKAHQVNDKAVMKAYEFSLSMTEPEIVAELMKLYRQLVDAEQKSK